MPHVHSGHSRPSRARSKMSWGQTHSLHEPNSVFRGMSPSGGLGSTRSLEAYLTSRSPYNAIIRAGYTALHAVPRPLAYLRDRPRFARCNSEIVLSAGCLDQSFHHDDQRANALCLTWDKRGQVRWFAVVQRCFNYPEDEVLPSSASRPNSRRIWT
jgi:hypothetical protein